MWKRTIVWAALIGTVSAFQSCQPVTKTHRMSTSTVLTKVSTPLPSVSQTRQASTTLSAAPLPISSSPLGAVSVLCFIVLVHEAGHYLAARYFGMDVEEFSVGVGPKLFGFKAFGDEFSLRALPLGGYVRFPENYNATLAEEMRTQAVKDAKAKLERARNGGGNIGSSLLNIITFGATERKRKEKEEKQQSQNDKRPWWKQLNEDDGLDVPEVEIPYYDNPNLLQNRPWQQRAVVLSGGVIFNLLLSFSIYFGQITNGPGLPSPVFEPGVLVSTAPRPNAASEGILRKGDVILDINGHPLTESASPTVFESQRAINDFISQIRSTPEGDSVKLTVLHGNKQEEVVSVKPKSQIGTNNGAPSIGVLLQPNFVKSGALQSKNPLEAARLAAQYTVTLTRETANGLLAALGSMFQSKGSSGVQVSGPIGLIRTGSDVVSTKDFAAIALFAAALSINLGVVNALPLPALDGGQLVFVIAEALTGRKVDQRIQEGITGVAVVFLLLLSLGAAVGDVSNIVVGR